MTNKRASLTCFVLAVIGCGRVVADDFPDRVFAQLVENWRWTHYWFGSSGIDDVYETGKKVSALVFWTKGALDTKRGMCAPQLAVCVAYSGPYLDPHTERMHIDPRVPVRQSFASFINQGFGEKRLENSGRRFQPGDFDSGETIVTLPALAEPSSLSERVVPQGADLEARRVKRLLGCGPIGSSTASPDCSGTLVFAYYGPDDPYWFVLRMCSSACTFRGDAIEELTRGDRNWEVTARGFVNGPGDEVDRLKKQVLKAEMFRIPL